MTLAQASYNITSAEQSVAKRPALQLAALRKAMRLQAVLTLLSVLVCAYFFGLHGMVSALLGGAISLVAAAVFCWMLQRSTSFKLTDTLVTMLKAEAAKIVTIIALLLLTFFVYRDVVALALIATFILTTVVFAGAAFMAPAASKTASPAAP